MGNQGPGGAETYMELKKFVRQGILDECHRYRTVCHYTGAAPGHVLMLLEGRARRKIRRRVPRSGGSARKEEVVREAFRGILTDLEFLRRRLHLLGCA